MCAEVLPPPGLQISDRLRDVVRKVEPHRGLEDGPIEANLESRKSTSGRASKKRRHADAASENDVSKAGGRGVLSRWRRASPESRDGARWRTPFASCRGCRNPADCLCTAPGYSHRPGHAPTIRVCAPARPDASSEGRARRAKPRSAICAAALVLAPFRFHEQLGLRRVLDPNRPPRRPNRPPAPTPQRRPRTKQHLTRISL